MKITLLKKVLSFILCIVLIAAVALLTTGCNDNNPTSSEPQSSDVGSGKTEAKIKEVGEGETEFFFNVVDLDGNVTKFKVFTDESTVGAALVKVALIAGDEGPYGLYVKTVNGLTLDYDKDGKYWAFYINDEMAPSGVDSTEITAGDTYAFKAE
ncbi:MAG: DUF4430 domain-containing protein [Ruminococcaceae bacterium]|nr:DUF4430 domain-containing protein [Oscillospiraceae bacterium]